MSAAKHTPGPWRVWGRTVSGTKGLLIEDQHGESIAVVHEGGIDDEADARLIAAAPDMLAVLQELAESAEYWSEYDVPLGIVDRIKAAIEKAEEA